MVYIVVGAVVSWVYFKWNLYLESYAKKRGEIDATLERQEELTRLEQRVKDESSLMLEAKRMEVKGQRSEVRS